MFYINPTTKQINLTRGDTAVLRVSAKNSDDTDYTFKIGDVVRFKVMKKKDCNRIVLQKDVEVQTAGTTVDIHLTKEDTKIEGIISKDVDYWYEVELNPETSPQTIIGYEVDNEGNKLEKIFKLLPEGSVEE